MLTYKKFFFIFILFFSLQNNSISDVPYFLDFKYILNQSEAGKKAQTFLQNKLKNGVKNLKTKEKAIQEEEKKTIQQKKLISVEEYKKKVNSLRSKVVSLQKERNKLLDDVAKQRLQAKNEIMKNLNPIIKTYMQENKIRMVLDKKSLLLADENLDITKNIIELLNKKIKSIKLK
tara:strand:+ start:74 stop:598 length:525 start_codon:yes stop_codon:yes gene_type:complete